MRRLLDVPAPAKLNLFLHITGRRDDGYHLLQSIFMLIDWCDRLHFERRSNGAISREDLTPMTLPADDLSVRAARALQAATGCAHGVHIGLEKHLPAEAGMGGGSSDAATTLLALNRLWGLGLNRHQLATIGLKLGADVPFFIGGHHAWVEGVGEQLTPVQLPKARFVVVKPPGGAATQRIFNAPELKRDTKTATIQGFAANDSREDAQAIGVVESQKILAFGHNDLQPVAQALCPDVGHCIQWLQDQGLQGRMTGSGTAVFAQMPQAMQLTTAPSDWTVRECSNMDVHPLLDWCSD
ncbi:4-(cytidine 5'-diphospho)-2-C-methyl-D-erythritol kinase [Hydrogenophaga sp. PBL-H3]|uniref:4-(cytidine 5'-diphospho)-2-C-methyl-D-erythritol kinase n=1 Tax=Hydrogenophaga sp. PBL-H3 TaxID=434010 RepID=UPI001320446B|nr:4-(cytidine 5'-diphospho)-2-C-methyl-D-erythritol kinase [Hydrogenophaga sp. PBL-H3]QHE78303.1 4-(cytidine 5'-diphospho)-2-C-methyl-D-erythritol kinase [Hydrogenophaga sp. PBL-H3]QHE82726.1 4-(cytidine 5'-diphospho)-2-C-methyl-D-erythritol kinase [Hydrogenophaga sp. PBL-H3]